MLKCNCGEMLDDCDVIIKQVYSGCRSTLFGDLEPPEFEYYCPFCGENVENMEEVTV